MTPYAGNNQSYPTAVNVPTGSDPPSSAVFDTTLEGTLDRTAWTSAHGTLSDLVTLQPAFAWPSGTFGPHAMCWNDTPLATDAVAGQKWLAAAIDSGLAHVQVFAGWADGSSNWSQVGGNISSPSTASDICVDAAGGIYVSMVASGTTANIFQRNVGGSFASFIVLSTLISVTDIRLGALAGGALFYAVGSATAAQAQISGAFGGGFSGLTASRWIVRSNGSMVLFVPGVAMASPTVYKATGTATYSSASIGLATTDVPQDLAWSAAWSKWVLVAKTAGGASTIWTSPDGATWTLAQTLSHLPLPISTLVAVGPWLIGAFPGTGAPVPDQLVSSADLGATWCAYPTGTIVTSSMTPKLVASPSGLLSLGLPNSNASVQANIRSSGLLGGSAGALLS